MTRLSERDRDILWEHRDYCQHVPRALPKLLQAVAHCDRYKQPHASITDDYDRFKVAETQRMLASWAPMDPFDALEVIFLTPPMFSLLL